MLRKAKELTNYRLHARDGDIGRVKDFYFDDRSWGIRYLVVDAGHWLDHRLVLISPEAVRETDWNQRSFPVDLTTAQVRGSPPVEADRPVSRQYELELRRHYGWPPYWGTAFAGAMAAPPPAPVPEPPASPGARGDPHLYSARDVTGYHLVASDGELGHVADFLIDDAWWNVGFLVVDIRNWLPGREVLISPAWTTGIDSAGRTIAINLTRDSIENSPPYDPVGNVDPDYAVTLAHYYSRQLAGPAEPGL
ncbi:MAG TPA: PRC-barrel domain-containing protein [Lacunisphaera sp.]|jgi:hypothetical protein|nr:PRC-barrel domain-containing protein [Lacunisphaera sp.]